MFIPLVPALLLTLLSFVSSVFVILYIVVPILPPNPLSRRVPPSEFGLPNYGKLSMADKCLLWLASLDILSLVVFVWEVVGESLWGHVDSLDPASTARLWFALTVKQTCLLVIAVITLLYLRLGQSVTFGAKHWIIAVPTFLIVCLSTSVAVVLSGAYVSSLYIGLVAFSSIVAVITTIAFICVHWTLVAIRRNLAALAEPWPPLKQMEEKPRPSFATEDVDILRDGASWITSEPGSRRNSISAWSFSTYHTAAPAHHSSIPPKSSFWFNPLSSVGHDQVVPPVPPLPSPYRGQRGQVLASDPDPFRRNAPIHTEKGHSRHASQSSWLTSPSVSQATLSTWSYPTSQSGHSEHCPDQLNPSLRPALASAQVLGGYGYSTGSLHAEKGLPALAANGNKIEISVYHTLIWLVIIWFPLALSLPYLITSLPKATMTSPVIPVLLVLSVTISAPLLAFTVFFRVPFPIPSGLFESELPVGLARATSPTATLPGLPSRKFSHEYRCSGSVTVVEGRRSGDVWVDNGDAVEGKGKVSRVLGMLVPKPRLAVLPQVKEPEDGNVTPPLPIQTGELSRPESPSTAIVPQTPESEESVEFGRTRKNSKASSHFSGADESLAYASRIMIAQRHYSAMAHTVVVPASPTSFGASQDLNIAKATGVVTTQASRPTSHLRSRSVSSISGPATPSAGGISISPPPPFPLPPTPPNVRAARLAQLGHKKSFSSGFSFGPVEDMCEIDALAAGVLPLLVPGLKVGPNMRIKPGGLDASPPFTFSKNNKAAKRALNALSSELGGLNDEDFPTPEVHSTPANTKQQAIRTRKVSGHKKNHFSLPSLGLSKDGIHSLANWKAEICRALESQIGKHGASHSGSVDLAKRAATGVESPASGGTPLEIVREESEEREFASGPGAQLGRSTSSRSLGLRADVPQGVDTARSSIATGSGPLSIASTLTLFELEADLESGPQAESTPPSALTRPGNQRLQTLQATDVNAGPRRSSIVYLKSENNVPATLTTVASDSAGLPAPTNTSSRLSQWSSRTIRPLIPKASKLKRKDFDLNPVSSTDKADSPGRGLRPLTLLKDRDINTIPNVHDAGGYGTTQPLSLRKKQKSRPALVNDENANVNSSPQSKHLKPLQLVRSETAKMRGILRRSEVLPDVVVRPPSESDYTSVVYTFAI